MQRWNMLAPIACAVILVSCFPDLQQITLMKSFNEVNFNAIKSDTLVVFDVDETLVQPHDAFVMNMHSESGRMFINY